MTKHTSVCSQPCITLIIHHKIPISLDRSIKIYKQCIYVLFYISRMYVVFYINTSHLCHKYVYPKSNLFNIWFSSLFQLRKPSGGSVSCIVLLCSIWIYLKKWPSKSGHFLRLCIKAWIGVWDHLKSKYLRNKCKTWCYQHPPCRTFTSSAAAARPQSLQTQSIIQSCSLHTSLLIFVPFSTTAQKTFFF